MAVTPNGIGGTFHFGNVSTSGAVTISPGGGAQSAAMMILGINFTTTTTTPETVTSITDNNGNTWQKYDSQTANSGWNTGQTVNGAQKSFTQEVWYCIGANIGNTLDVTVAFSGTIDGCSIVHTCKLLGYDSSHPFDLNASLPKKLKVGASAAETITGISTDTAHGWPIWVFGAWGTDLSVSNVQFNSVSRNDQDSQQHNQSEFLKTQVANGPAITSAYSSVTFASPTSASNFFIMGLVVTSDAQSVVAPKPANVTNIVITN